MLYTCSLPTVICQNVYNEKRPTVILKRKGLQHKTETLGIVKHMFFLLYYFVNSLATPEIHLVTWWRADMTVSTLLIASYSFYRSPYENIFVVCLACFILIIGLKLLFNASA